MKTIGFLAAALAMATAAPAMAMNGRPDHSSSQTQVYAASASVLSRTAQPCVRRVDRFGNIHVMCPTLRQARAAWFARRPFYPRNFVVHYRDGDGRVRVWRQWTRPGRPR
jgi:hypothetical protein